MTDKEFITYIGKMLLYSGEDCCSKCAFSSKRRLCDNQKKAEKLGTPPDDDICIEGMRKYAEKMEKEE